MPRHSMTIRHPRVRGMVVRLLLPFLVPLMGACGGDLPPEGGVASGPTLPASPSIGATLDLLPAGGATLGEHVRALAEGLASLPYTPPDTLLPRGLAELEYSDYQDLRFRPDSALWRGESPFEVQLFHRGFLFPRRVEVNVVDGEEVAPVPYRPSWFAFGERVQEATAELPEGLGYAGFRVHYPLNNPAVQDEIVVFLGASYFRLLGPGHAYGLSARGLAVNTIGAQREEFPDFREFWLVRPEPGDSTLVFHALLDGPSVVGAYRFELIPTPTTTLLEVESHLYARQDVEMLGVAPLTSMFLYGPNRAGDFDDVRPRVHDSDGLLMHTRQGQWIWRPLSNRRALQVTTLLDIDPQGFGLAQRERSFEAYLDLEALYHRRPSQWVSPEGAWGEGGVQLVEITGLSEFGDNIVAYWRPQEPFQAGDGRHYRYTIHTFDRRLPEQTLAQVERTVIGWDALPGEGDPPPRSQRRFVVDFVPGDRAPVPAPGEGTGGVDPDGGGGGDPDGGGGGEPDGALPVEAVLRSSSGTLSDIRVLPLPGGGWRATFRLQPEGTAPADLLLHLVRGDTTLSETWSYLWIPESDG